MASLAAHFTASLFLCPLAFRRLFSSSSLYLKNPSLYTSRIWYFTEPKWKNLDLYTLLVALPIASLSHLFIFLAFSDNPSYRFSFLQQSFVVFFFWAVLVLVGLKESMDLGTIPESFVFLFAGIGFLIEFYMSGRGVVGLGGAVYGILGGLAVFCAGCCLCLSIRPKAFFAEFLLCCGIFLKGTWVLQVGLSFYTVTFGLKGCDKIAVVNFVNGEADVKCELQDDMWRGMVLMNVIFVGHVIVVILISFVLFGLLHRYMKIRDGSGFTLADIGSESMLMHPLPELGME